MLSYLAIALLCAVTNPVFAAVAPDLGSTSPFAIVSETYSNTTAGTTIGGDVCFTTPPAVTPTISGTTETPCLPQRGTDQNTALADLNAQSCTSLGAAVALNAISIGGGPPGVIPPGCYSSTGAMSIATGTTVTLNGNGVYIFRPDGAMNAAADSAVVATDGACENDVYWTPTGGTTIGANSDFVGSIFRGTAAGLSITLGDGATLTGRALAFGSTVTTDNNDIAIPTCAPIPPGETGFDPDITLLKTITAGDPFSAVGDTITYSLVAENTGNVTLTNVTISDPNVTVDNCTPAQGATLQPGETMSCDGSYTVILDDINAGSFINTAMVEVTDPNDVIVEDSDSVTATATVTPDITLLKTITAGDPFSAVGDTITYSLVAENTGNVTLTNVTISDPNVTVDNCTPAQGATLQPGETMSCDGSYTVILADINAGSFINIAMVEGTDPNDVIVEDSDSVTATATVTPDITLLKTITAGDPFSAVGDTITYSLVAENTGNVTLTNVTISDPNVIVDNCTPAQGATLQPGETMSCDGSYTFLDDINAGSFINTAMVEVTDPNDVIVESSDSVTATFNVGIPAAEAIPTLSGWAMILLAALLAMSGLVLSRQHLRMRLHR